MMQFSHYRQPPSFLQQINIVFLQLLLRNHIRIESNKKVKSWTSCLFICTPIHSHSLLLPLTSHKSLNRWQYTFLTFASSSIIFYFPKLPLFFSLALWEVNINHICFYISSFPIRILAPSFYKVAINIYVLCIK